MWKETKMTSTGKDDADHLAAYAEHLMAHAKAAVALANQKQEDWLVSRREALRLILRARMAIREAHVQLR
jgi:hypothetical protein